MLIHATFWGVLGVINMVRVNISRAHSDFHKICRICTSFHVALAIKVLLDLLKGLWSYGGLNLTGCGYPQIFSVPSGETYASDGDRINRSRRILTRKRALWVS